MKSYSALLVLMLLAGCSRSSNPQKPTAALRVLCGSSMAGPMRELGDRFKALHGVEVEVDLGGSETLLPKILAGAAADIFICHDPFEQKVKEAGKWSGSSSVGVLQPVLLVRPGNPNQIETFDDLTNATLKLGIGDPRYSTCGEMFVNRLDQKNIRLQVMNQVVLQARSHAEIANGLILGPLDAVVVWNFVARLYTNKVELVPTDDPYPDVKVTVVGLSSSPNPRLRDAFCELCRTEAVKALFEQHGYGAIKPVSKPKPPAVP